LLKKLVAIRGGDIDSFSLLYSRMQISIS